MKTYRQWLRTKDGLRFKELMDKNIFLDIAMLAAWDAGRKYLEEQQDKDNLTSWLEHEAWCQINYPCNCGAEK